MGVHMLAGLTFLTAMSGAFVAGTLSCFLQTYLPSILRVPPLTSIGLDAGLLYPEIPYMGDGLVPVEYWELEPAYKNLFENGAAVQFNHRLLVR